MTTDIQKKVKADLSEIVKFHGLVLFIYETGNQTYIPIKPIVDLIGTDWRTARKSIISGDNMDLYGTTTLLVPKVDNSGGLMLTKTGSGHSQQEEIKTEETQNTELNELLCIRFDRVHMYLARVNTSRLRVNGNVKAADYLLKLQHEWADVLHNYETHGIAINKSKLEHTKYLTQLCGLYQKLDNPQQRAHISKQIDDALDLQQPIPKSDKQGDLLN